MAFPRTASVLGAPAFCLSVCTAHAIGLSDISQQSGLGEPLRLVIPLIANAADQIADDDLAGECFKVVPATANDVPQLSSARVTLERRGPQAFVVLTTAYPVEEPIMRVAVQAGCRMQISREYTVLFDPVPIQPPAVQAAAAAVIQPQRSSGAVDVSAEQVDRASPRVTTAPRAAPPPQRPSTPVQRSINASRAKPTTGTETTSVNVATGLITQSHRPQKPSSGPRLQISRTLGDESATPAATKPKNAADKESLMALEEQTVVLQRRIAELAVQMERIDAELRAAQLARAVAEKKAALAATERAAAEAASAQPLTRRGWLADNWPLLVLAPALITLIVALLWRRAQRPLAPRPFTATQAASFNAADLGEPSVPKPDAERDREGVVASMKDRARAHVIPPVFVEPIEPDKPDKTASPQTHYQYDPGISVADMTVEDVNFDEEVRKAYEAASEYSVLEREEPGIVARLVDGWGTPRSTAQLENILLTPRRSGKPLSTGAIEELKLLRSIAMERVADLDSTMQRWIGNPRTPPGAVAGTH